MSHPEQLGFLRLMREQVCPDATTALEIGSYDVNSSGAIRQIFAGVVYTGVDLTEGPGVDLVASGHEVDLPPDSFDVVLATECFEHNPVWRETFDNMIRMTKPGGIVIMTCATTGRVEHGTARSALNTYSPGTTSVGWQYYRNLTRRDFENAFDLSGRFQSHYFYRGWTSHDLYFFGQKLGGEPRAFDLPAIQAGVERLGSLRRGGLKSRARDLGRLPLQVLSHVVPEPVFQNLAVPYSKFLYALGRAVGLET